MKTSSSVRTRRRRRCPGTATRWRCAFAAVLLLGLTGCSYYSFSGATIPQEYQTIAIVPVENATTSQLQNLEGQLTDFLNARFVERTRLRLETNENRADVVLTGRIIEYTEEPTAVSGDEVATQNQVTIIVEMRYYESESGEDLLNDTYRQSDVYDTSGGLSTGANEAARNVLEDIADDVFAAATSNW